MSVPIALLASGRGSNCEAIWKAIDSGELSAHTVVVLSDQPTAPVLEKARARGIPTAVVPFPSKGDSGPSIGERRKLHDQAVMRELNRYQPRFLVMAGYMRIVSPLLIEAYRSERGYSRIVNIHPSLLPAFPGTDGYGKAYRHGVKVTGVTVHLVDDVLDGGPICAQEAFSIADCRSEKEVEERGFQVEHRLYSAALKWILPEKFAIVPLSSETQDSQSSQDTRRLSVRPN